VSRYQEPAEAYYTVAPDWVCEIASPSTAKVDREFVGTETVRAVPFDDIELDLKRLWG
jgi:hypothetical protein